MYQNNTDDLQHWGIPGMKWGVRRFQNRDGSLTPAGRKRAAKLEDQYKRVTGRQLSKKPSSTNSAPDNKKRTVKDMSDTELREKTNRMRLENDYVRAMNDSKNLNPAKVSKGKKITNTIMDSMVKPAMINIGKQLCNSALAKLANDGLDLKDTEYRVYANNKKKD